MVGDRVFLYDRVCLTCVLGHTCISSNVNVCVCVYGCIKCFSVSKFETCCLSVACVFCLYVWMYFCPSKVISL